MYDQPRFASSLAVSSSHLSHTVDLLVDLSSVVVALLTGPRHGEADARRMPRTDTRHLAETLVSLARQLLGVPARSYT